MYIAADNVQGLSVAHLGLWLDGRGANLRLAAPPCHAKFLVSAPPDPSLRLKVSRGSLPSTTRWRSLFNSPETWQLWLDEGGRYVFSPPKSSPPRRQVTVDAAFRSGEVVGEFADQPMAQPAVFPLQDIDMMILANWLADAGDLILHASGVAVDGQAYCFVGAAGAGKSTLASHLALNPAATVLGEDQVILRRIAGQFWIFGTPWHQNPARCSPLGVPLAKLFFLDRALPPGAQPCPHVEAVTRLLQTAFIPYYRPEAVSRILDTLAGLGDKVPLFKLSYLLGSDAMKLIREA